MGLFNKNSDEYKLLMNRVKMGCAAQSRQIDKTKIGEAVKGIPKIWSTYQKILEEDSIEDKQKKQFYNSLLVDKKPYFFRYKYKTLNKELNDYTKKSNEDSIIRFNITLKELLSKKEEELTEEEKVFIELYKKYLPVLDSPCVMNKICHYIEDQDFKIRQMVKTQNNFDYKILMSNNFNLNKKIYNNILIIMEDFFKQRKNSQNNIINNSPEKDSTKNFGKEKLDKDNKYILLKKELEEICSNEEILANHLIYLFYVDKASYSKSVLWALVGKQIYLNILNRTKSYYFPQKNLNGNLEFLYEKYSIERILIEEKD